MYGCWMFHVVFVCVKLGRRGDWWGEVMGEAERGPIEVLASVYVCVWVSLSPFFPPTHNSSYIFCNKLLFRPLTF